MTLVLQYVSLNICGIDAILSPLDGQIEMHRIFRYRNFDQVIRYLGIVNFGILNNQAVRPNVKPNCSQVKSMKN